MRRWDTWEELLLGGAVLRHGTADWNLVAKELALRLYPCSFTPQVCKAKYEDLVQRYSGCTAWFEELKKQRMAELRRALEQSEDSIGSLESKLESLKTEKEDYHHVDYKESQPHQKYEGVDSSSKDGLSAASFTQETRANWSPDCQNEDMERKTETSKQERVLSIEKLAQTMFVRKGVRKRRGKRKRKDCSKDMKDGSIGESDIISPRFVVNENSMCDSERIAKSFGGGDQSKETVRDLSVTGIFDSVLHNDCASVFRRRLDSQKRGRYKKMILRHMDFDTLRSRVTSGSITSAAELFRDMLLIANNALVFYSKSTREYKSALLLRGIVTKALKQHLKDYCTKVKQPSNENSLKKVGNVKNSVVAKTSNGGGNREAPLLGESTKKSFCRPRKVGRGNGRQQPESATVKARKRTLAR